jgi:hypothetical protein
MATVHLENRLVPCARIVNAVMHPPSVEGPDSSLLQTLAVVGRKLLGAVLLLLGILMISTLLLLPIGLPMVLLAVALIAAPSRP